jgi:hypothetical protein
MSTLTTTPAPTIPTDTPPFQVGQRVIAVDERGRCPGCKMTAWALVELAYDYSRGDFECQNPACVPCTRVMPCEWLEVEPTRIEVKLGASPDLFEHLAIWANNNVGDDDEDLVSDVIAAMCPHMTAEVAQMHWEDLRTGIIARDKAEEGDHPGDVDSLTWAEQCRDAVLFTAEQMAGLR